MKVGDLMEQLISSNTKDIYDEEMKPLLTIKISAPAKESEEDEMYSLKNPKKKKKKKDDK